MSNPNIIPLNVGDVVRERGDDRPSVVTGVSEGLNLALFCIDERLEWRFTMPGTSSGPVEKLGSISVETVAEGMARCFAQPMDGEYYHEALQWLQEESKQDPALVPGLETLQP